MLGNPQETEETVHIIQDNNNLSEYPSPPLIPRNPYYPSRSVHCLSFVRPYAHTNQYSYSFFHILFPYGIISLMM